MKNDFSKALAPEEKEGKAKTRQEARKLCAVILAIFKMPFMHRLTQSMAENTYVRSRGKNIIKTKIAENTSNTLEQQKVRVRMKLAEFLSRVFYTPAQVAFPQRRRDLTALNACVQAIMRAITRCKSPRATWQCWMTSALPWMPKAGHSRSVTRQAITAMAANLRTLCKSCCSNRN